MTYSIDKIYFKELAGQNPEDICRQSICKYDYVNKIYTLPVWGDEYAIYPHEFKIDLINKIAQKVGEEAVELIIEAKDNDEDKFKNECADLLYHLLILLEAKQTSLDEVVDILVKRHK